MTSESAGPAGPWWNPIMLDWLASWWRPGAIGPEQLDQPILPGWTLAPSLTINAGNSSAPATELEILQHHSYGRQLGRIADALQALLDERAEATEDDDRITAFRTMQQQIAELKAAATRQRLDRLRADLAELRATRPQEYQDLLADLPGPGPGATP